jgi:type IV pilus assembly protein PilC
VLFGGGAGAVFYARTKQGGKIFDAMLLRFPTISPIIKKINLARFARILSSMMKSGISIVEGLTVSAEALGNYYYKEAVLKIAEEVKLGKDLTHSLEQNEQLFPVIVVQMLEVGQETGSLETILEQLAQHYEAEIDNTMKNLSSVIEPLLLLVIGGVVGVLAMALISPIYNLSQSVG